MKRINGTTLNDIDPETGFDCITSDYDEHVYILIIPPDPEDAIPADCWEHYPTLYEITNNYGIPGYRTPDKNLALRIMADLEGQLFIHRSGLKNVKVPNVLEDNYDAYKFYKQREKRKMSMTT